MHKESHPQAHQTITIGTASQDPRQKAVVPGAQFVVEDWWDRIANQSWMYSNGNPAALHYAMRNALMGLPIDDEVIYGKIDGIGHIIHTSEIAE